MKHCMLANSYRTFDLDYVFEKECETDIIILQRNREWIKVIPDLLKTKNTFIAVGYYHLRKMRDFRTTKKQRI